MPPEPKDWQKLLADISKTSPDSFTGKLAESFKQADRELLARKFVAYAEYILTERERAAQVDSLSGAEWIPMMERAVKRGDPENAEYLLDRLTQFLSACQNIFVYKPGLNSVTQQWLEGFHNAWTRFMRLTQKGTNEETPEV